ncbi:MAG: hypothetical protein QW735_04500 [archaeon]
MDNQLLWTSIIFSFSNPNDAVKKSFTKLLKTFLNQFPIKYTLEYKKNSIEVYVKPKKNAELDHEEFLEAVTEFTNKFEYISSMKGQFAIPAEISYDFYRKNSSLYIDYDFYDMSF